VPTIVGRKGVEAQLEIELWPREVSSLQHSGQVLRETIDQVLKKNPGAARPAAARPAAPAAVKGNRPIRVTMGSGGNGNGSAGGSGRVTISGQKSGGRHG
jgi:L-lactate dehydrogenase